MRAWNFFCVTLNDTFLLDIRIQKFKKGKFGLEVQEGNAKNFKVSNQKKYLIRIVPFVSRYYNSPNHYAANLIISLKNLHPARSLML